MNTLRLFFLISSFFLFAVLVQRQLPQVLRQKEVLSQKEGFPAVTPLTSNAGTDEIINFFQYPGSTPLRSFGRESVSVSDDPAGSVVLWYREYFVKRKLYNTFSINKNQTTITVTMSDLKKIILTVKEKEDSGSFIFITVTAT